ncbi:hypothetical protein BH24ACT13_BH24ACT13_04920 [soil metagenome]
MSDSTVTQVIHVPDTAGGPGGCDDPPHSERQPSSAAVVRPSGATRGPGRAVGQVRRRRSLTVPAAVLCVVAFTLLGAGIDVLVGRGLGIPFAVGFIVGSALAAARVRGNDLLAGPVVPPLALVGVVAAVAPLLPGSSGSWLTDVIVQVGTALVLDAPVLLVGTAVAAGIAVTRRLRRPVRPPQVSRPASRP